MALERAFEDDPAFVPYIAAGDPTPEATKRYVEALVEGGADAVELGLPFSEPIAEGGTIQSAIVRSLEGGMTPERFFELVEDLEVEVPLVAMTYYNLVYQYGRGRPGPDGEVLEGPGVEPFVRRAAEAGIEGLIIPDLPVDESDPLVEACEAHGLDLVFIVAPTTTDRRLERILERVSGYVYVQARLGTTGAREDVSTRTGESLARLSEVDLPKAVGFGISEGDHAERVIRAGADGVIVGSAIVDVIAAGVEAGDDHGAVADRLRELARDLKAGALRGAPDARPETDGGDPTSTGTDGGEPDPFETDGGDSDSFETDGSEADSRTTPGSQAK